MARSYEEIRRAAYQQAADAVERQYGARKKADEEQLGQIGAAIDREAGAATAGYQNRISGAADEYQPLYDRNALQEMISRRQVEESMANMGLTNSGLNRTQQTAITLQRSNADAATRKQQRDYVTKAQEAIDSILASAASQKAQQEAAVHKATADWYTSAMAGAEQSSAQSAATQYQAEQEYAAQIEAAQIEAAAKEEAARIEAQRKAISDNNAARAKYAQALLTSKVDGMDENRAWASAFARFGTGNEKTDTFNTNYNAALNTGYSGAAAEAYANAGGGAAGIAAAEEINGQIATNIVNEAMAGKKVYWTTPGTFFGSPSGGDADWAYTIAKENLTAATGYAKADKKTQDKAMAIAIGYLVGKKWKTDTRNGDDKTNVRIKCAMKKAGMSDDYYKDAVGAAATAAKK